MTQYGTRVDAPIVAGNDNDDDLPSAYGDQLGRAFHHFEDISARDFFTGIYKSRLNSSFCFVASNADGSAEIFKWTGTKVDGSDGSWHSIVELDMTGTGGSSGIEIDDGVTNESGITKLNLKGIGVTGLPSTDGRGDHEADITAGANIYVSTSPQYGGNLVYDIAVEPPLLVRSNPDKQNAVFLYLEHDKFESMKPPSKLAYIESEVEVLVTDTDPDSHKSGALWFDNVVVDSGDAYLHVNKDNKSIGLEEADQLDPNVSGGTDYLVKLFIKPKGIATSDGWYRAYIGHEQGVGLPFTYAKDKYGNLLIEEVHYKENEPLPTLEVTGIINAKGESYYTFHLIKDSTSDPVVIGDLSGILVQAITSNYKTSPAMLQYQLNTGNTLEIETRYVGESLVTLGWVVRQTIPVTTGTAGSGSKMSDGLELHNLTQMKFGVQSGHVILEDDGININDFYFGKTLDTQVSKLLRGKEVTISTTLVDKDSAWDVGLFKWTGVPDRTTSLFDSRNNGSIILNRNWVLVDKIFISEDVLSGDHTETKDITVPDDANNLGLFIYPSAAQQPQTLKLKELKLDCKEPFNGTYLHQSVDTSNIEYYKSDRHKSLAQGTQGFGALRYTINSGWTPMPCGEVKSGGADVVVDPSVNRISGSAASGGEGAIKFEVEGQVSLETSVRVWNEEGTDNQLQLQWFKVDSTGSVFTPIADSLLDVTVKASSKNILYYMPTLKLRVSAGDRIALRAKASKDDGAFLQCISNDKPLVEAKIDIEELVNIVNHADFVTYPEVHRIAYDIVDNKVATLTITDVDIPANSVLANWNIISKSGDSITSESFHIKYDDARDELQLAGLSNIKEGKLLLEFWRAL